MFDNVWLFFKIFGEKFKNLLNGSFGSGVNFDLLVSMLSMISWFLVIVILFLNLRYKTGLPWKDPLMCSAVMGGKMGNLKMQSSQDSFDVSLVWGLNFQERFVQDIFS